jgi:hypothetical protein
MTKLKGLKAISFRRAHHESGFDVSVSDELIKIYRVLGDKNKEDFRLVAETTETGGILSFSVKAGINFMSNSVKYIHINLIKVPSDYIINDAFSLKTESKSYRYKINVSTTKRKVAIKMPPKKQSEKYIFFIEILCGSDIAAFNDYIEFSDISSCSSKHFLDFVKNGYNDIIFTKTRFISSFLNDKSSAMLISFAAINVPEYKYNTADFFYGVECHRLILNDPKSEWYTLGVSDLGSNLADTINTISTIKKSISVRDICCFGASMGAFGAILYGQLLKAKKVIAFNPEINLFSERSRSTNFFKTRENCPDTYNSVEFCLAKPVPDISLYYCIEDPIDSKFYNYCKEKDFPITLNPLQMKHELNEFLKSAQFLVDIINDFSTNSKNIFWSFGVK